MEGDDDQAGHTAGPQFNEVPMPQGRGILVEGEESVVSFLLTESIPDYGIETILEHPGPDWFTGVWLDELAVMRPGIGPIETLPAVSPRRTA